MKKLPLLLYLLFFLFVGVNFSYAQTVTPIPVVSTNDIPMQICGCYPELGKIYEQMGGADKCVGTFDEFKTNPKNNHLWIEDSEVTAQGKSNDRARQFIYWVITHNAIDNYPVLTSIWGTARNLAYLFTIISAALLGLAIIIGQKTSFNTGVKIWPAVTKILTSLLYISFSATIVILTIQLSEGVKIFLIFIFPVSVKKKIMLILSDAGI
jgi:hypothetical protein